MQTVKNTIAENTGGTHSLAKPEHQFSLEDCPDQSGKVAVITGGSEGIGYGCAHTLLKNNLTKLFIIAVSQEVYDDAVEDISKTISPEAAQRCTFLQCDMSDWPAVSKVAHTISEGTDRVDILCNLAARGIMTYQLTDYGLDRHMAVNHFGHVVLTSHLLPILKQTAEAGHIDQMDNMDGRSWRLYFIHVT
ncbi:hypothetical protein SS1G_14366 [Sclerotinia sclerotiorum 1980 UF-70]|uniref:Oxidoreductase n=1 Tax=Sclerotinia sclerotiorum (strain ATCC 18683 / 1980 / Ss-1) TaxID=665079 RepID=A7F9T5_SCLS1|nr:hypothetical protein SS1G_14366 [Sclerotinia sclerotiorum 1980 UF-70]EDO00496.1 hypothetical protein SS1G_14366 [Sclerotinia sclerotiorum 1980 UF-70]